MSERVGQEEQDQVTEKVLCIGGPLHGSEVTLSSRLGGKFVVKPDPSINKITEEDGSELLTGEETTVVYVEFSIYGTPDIKPLFSVRYMRKVMAPAGTSQDVVLQDLVSHLVDRWVKEAPSETRRDYASLR